MQPAEWTGQPVTVVEHPRSCLDSVLSAWATQFEEQRFALQDARHLSRRLEDRVLWDLDEFLYGHEVAPRSLRRTKTLDVLAVLPSLAAEIARERVARIRDLVCSLTKRNNTVPGGYTVAQELLREQRADDKCRWKHVIATR